MAKTNPVKVPLTEITDAPEDAAAVRKNHLRDYIYCFLSKYYFSSLEGNVLLDDVKEYFKGFTVDLFDQVPKENLRSICILLQTRSVYLRTKSG